MNGAGEAHRQQIYPRRLFDVSPTWFAWNKLTAADVYALREEPGFEGQNIYFWLNHPIQFVRLVGVVVQIDLVGSGWYTLITLDDSSGANIEIKIEKRRQSPIDHAVYPSNTTIDNVDVLVELGLPTVHIDKQPIQVGTIIKAAGCLINWRQERQLELKRVSRVCDTNEEAAHWSKAAEWKRTVLSKPWVLTQERLDALNMQFDQEDALERKRIKRNRERQAKHDMKRNQRELEKERRLEAKAAELDAGALKGSEVLPAPWA